MDQKFIQAMKPLPPTIGAIIKKIPESIQAKIQEVRIRKDKPLVIICRDQTLFLTKTGQPTSFVKEGLITPNCTEVEETLRAACAYSLHSHVKDIANGFITIEGGHRIGVCGTAVWENNTIFNQRNISSLSIRIAREFKGAANQVMELFQEENKGMLIAGPPSSGKTTLLRDLARQLSDKMPFRKVTVIDERSEIAAMYRGIPQNDIGVNTDVLDGFPKGDGILQAVRTLSPDVILCDEIGGQKECEAILSGLNSGVVFIASVHASSMEELTRKIQVKALMDCYAFETVVFLQSRESPSQVEKIFQRKDGWQG